MDYTSSNAFATDAGTGNRLHQQSAAVTTAVTDADMNGLIWEMLSVIRGAGLTPVAFDKTVPSTYNQVYQAIQALIATAVAPDYKTSVRYTTTGNITLSGLATQAGGDWPSALTAGDRVLPKDQTTSSQNGIYIAAAGAWTRATDADGAGELTSGAIVAVEEGTVNADSQWMLTTDGAITIGTTALTFARQGAAAVKQIQSLPDPTLASNAMTLPASTHTLDFRSTTLGSGLVTTVTGTAAALVIPSGATLGTVSGQQSTIVHLIINNGGTLEKAVINLAGGNDLSETGTISTTAISAGATAANVFYSNTARTGVAYRVAQSITSTQAAAGTWAVAPSTVQGQGGQALAAMSSFGYGQTWQNVLGSRAVGTTYYNLTGKPISVSIQQTTASTPNITVNGVVAATAGYGGYAPVIFTVPPGASYSIASGSVSQWAELR